VSVDVLFSDVGHESKEEVEDNTMMAMKHGLGFYATFWLSGGSAIGGSGFNEDETREEMSGLWTARLWLSRPFVVQICRIDADAVS
jgi:hypothetical protein